MEDLNVVKEILMIKVFSTSFTSTNINLLSEFFLILTVGVDSDVVVEQLG